MTESTYEERMRVARDTCRTEGHDLRFILLYQHLAPQYVTCGRCGSGWGIQHSDQDFPALTTPILEEGQEIRP